MKYLILFSLIFCVTIGCKNESQSIRDQKSTTAPSATTTPTSIPTSVDGIVYHYICPKACGGGDSAGTCPVCGSAYAHNQAFHNQPQTSANSSEGLSPIIQQPTNAQNPTSDSNTKTEPAQNAAGIWHYTCSNGCAGGAGSALACASCGSTLVHNQAYHN